MKARILLTLTILLLCAGFAVLPKAQSGLAAYPPPETATQTAHPPLTMTAPFPIPTMYPAEKTAMAKHIATQTMVAYICEMEGLEWVKCVTMMTEQAQDSGSKPAKAESTPEPEKQVWEVGGREQLKKRVKPIEFKKFAPK